MSSLPNALTFDIEDYFQVSGFGDVIDRRDWDDFPSRVVESTRRIIQLLDRCDTRATFFILGWVADRFPQLVEEIAERDHEIATTGYGHQLL